MRRKSVLVQYFITFATIGLFLLVLSASVILYLDHTSTISKIETTHYAAMSQLLGKMDYLVESMNNVALHFSSTEEELGYPAIKALPDTPVTDRLISQRLNSYQENVLSDVAVALYQRGGTQVYLSDGKHPYTAFETMVGEPIKVSQAKLFSTMNSSKTEAPLYFPGEDSIAFVYPIPYASMIPEASLVFLLSDLDMITINKNFMGTSPHNLYVINENLKIIYEHEVTPLTPEEKLKIQRLQGTYFQPLTLQGTAYIATRALSEHSGMSVVSLTEKSVFYATLRSRQGIILLVTLGVALAILLVSYLLSSQYYRPVQHLLHSTLGASVKSELVQHRNEFDILNEHVRQMVESKEALGEIVEMQASYVYQTSLLNILFGKAEALEDITLQTPIPGLRLPGSYYQVLLVSLLTSKNISAQINSIQLLFGQLSHEHLLFFAVELVTENHVAVLVNSTKQAMEAETLRLTKELQEVLEREFLSPTFIGLGTVQKGIKNAHSSYIEARVVVENFGTSAAVLPFSLLPSQETQDLSISFTDKSVLVQALKQGNLTVALDSLSKALSRIRESGGSFLVTQYLCFDISNTLIKAANQLKQNIPYADLQQLSNFRNFSSFEQVARELVQTLCRSFEQQQEKEQGQLNRNILQYVSEQFRENSLSLDTVADEFSVSGSYLIRLFKEQTDETFLQYIITLRMAYVREQLVTSSQQIKDIVLAAGYLDVSSFNRKFKELEGVTPGQYRRMYSTI